MVKNCDLGLENAASIFKTEVTVFHHTDRPLAGTFFFFFFNLTKYFLKESE